MSSPRSTYVYTSTGDRNGKYYYNNRMTKTMKNRAHIKKNKTINSNNTSGFGGGAIAGAIGGALSGALVSAQLSPTINKLETMIEDQKKENKEQREHNEAQKEDNKKQKEDNKKQKEDNDKQKEDNKKQKEDNDKQEEDNKKQKEDNKKQKEDNDKQRGKIPVPLEIKGSQLYRDINTDNDFGENSNLSNQEMVDYYGKNSELTDYAILQKYKEFGQIDLKNEKEKLPEWDRMMREAQNEASIISDYVDNNGTRFGGYVFFGGEKFLTDDDLLAQGLSGKDIETIKKYDLINNGGDNDGKISKKEAINAGVLGNATFQQHEVGEETQTLANSLGGEDNIITQNELSVLKDFGYDPSKMFNKYKTNIGNKTGIVKGDFEDAMEEIDLKSINDYINTLPNEAREKILAVSDIDGDGKISSKKELAHAIKNANMLREALQHDQLNIINLQLTLNSGHTLPLITLYNKHLKNEYNFKYDDEAHKFVSQGKMDPSTITFDREQTKDIMLNGREFLDIGTVSLNKVNTDCLVLLDDPMKTAIAKTYGKDSFEDCTEQDVRNFEKKWQCHTESDVFNLGALKNDIINTESLFNGQEIISTDTFNAKTIAGFDQTGLTAKILDYADGCQDGYINLNIFLNKITLNGQVIELDQNHDGIVKHDELNSFCDQVKNIVGEEEMNKIISYPDKAINNTMANESTHDLNSSNDPSNTIAT